MTAAQILDMILGVKKENAHSMIDGLISQNNTKQQRGMKIGYGGLTAIPKLISLKGNLRPLEKDIASSYLKKFWRLNNGK